MAKPERFNPRTKARREPVGEQKSVALNLHAKATTGGHVVCGGQNGWMVEHVNRGDLWSIERVGPRP